PSFYTLSLHDALPILHPEVAHQLAAVGEASHAERAHVQQFLSGFHIVRQPERMPRVEKEFLLGAGPDWADIHANLDAHRDCEDRSEEHTSELQSLAYL